MDNEKVKIMVDQVIQGPPPAPPLPSTPPPPVPVDSPPLNMSPYQGATYQPQGVSPSTEFNRSNVW